MAITQLSHDPHGRAYYRDKRAAGKSHREALRCLKRRLSDAVYRRLMRDAHPDTATGPGGHSGVTTKSSAAGSTPTTDSSDKSLPGPADTDPTNPPKDPLDAERCRRARSLQHRQSVRPVGPLPSRGWSWPAESAPICRQGPHVRDDPIFIADTLTDGSIGGHPSGRVPSGDGPHPRSSDPHDSAHRHGGASHRSSPSPSGTPGRS